MDHSCDFSFGDEPLSKFFSSQPPIFLTRLFSWGGGGVSFPPNINPTRFLRLLGGLDWEKLGSVMFFDLRSSSWFINLSKSLKSIPGT